MTPGRVEVPAALLYGGIALTIGLLVAVGYLAGRASSGGAVVEPAGAVDDRRPAALAEAPAPSDPRPAPDAAAIPLENDPVLAADVPPAAGAASTLASGAPAPISPVLRRAVAAYFQEMDAIQSAGPTGSDPTALAHEILGQAMRGDSAGFDKLIAASRAARDGVRSIVAPPPCAEHHRLTLGLLDEGIVMLTTLRAGMASGDASGLAAVASSGSTLEARARGVEALAASIKSRYATGAAE